MSQNVPWTPDARPLTVEHTCWSSDPPEPDLIFVHVKNDKYEVCPEPKIILSSQYQKVDKLRLSPKAFMFTRNYPSY